jgi:hypothetical protein
MRGARGFESLLKISSRARARTRGIVLDRGLFKILGVPDHPRCAALVRNGERCRIDACSILMP